MFPVQTENDSTIELLNLPRELKLTILYCLIEENPFFVKNFARASKATYCLVKQATMDMQRIKFQRKLQSLCNDFFAAINLSKQSDIKIKLPIVTFKNNNIDDGLSDELTSEIIQHAELQVNDLMRELATNLLALIDNVTEKNISIVKSILAILQEILNSLANINMMLPFTQRITPTLKTIIYLPTLYFNPLNVINKGVLKFVSWKMQKLWFANESNLDVIDFRDVELKNVFVPEKCTFNASIFKFIRPGSTIKFAKDDEINNEFVKFCMAAAHISIISYNKANTDENKHLKFQTTALPDDFINSYDIQVNSLNSIKVTIPKSLIPHINNPSEINIESELNQLAFSVALSVSYLDQPPPLPIPRLNFNASSTLFQNNKQPILKKIEQLKIEQKKPPL